MQLMDVSGQLVSGILEAVCSILAICFFSWATVLLHFAVSEKVSMDSIMLPDETQLEVEKY